MDIKDKIIIIPHVKQWFYLYADYSINQAASYLYAFFTCYSYCLENPYSAGKSSFVLHTSNKIYSHSGIHYPSLCYSATAGTFLYCCSCHTIL